MLPIAVVQAKLSRRCLVTRIPCWTSVCCMVMHFYEASRPEAVSLKTLVLVILPVNVVLTS
jgi:hypothetical protein